MSQSWEKPAPREAVDLMRRFLLQVGRDMLDLGVVPVFALNDEADVEKLAQILARFTVDDRAIDGALDAPDHPFAVPDAEDCAEGSTGCRKCGKSETEHGGALDAAPPTKEGAGHEVCVCGCERWQHLSTTRAFAAVNPVPACMGPCTHCDCKAFALDVRDAAPPKEEK